MTAALEGAPGGWSRLIERLEPVARRAATYCGARGADRDDACAATMLKLYEHLSEIREARCLTSWVTTVARREVITARRHARRLSLVSRPPEVSVNFPDTAERLTAEAVVHRGRGAFERLSGFERRLLAFDLDNPGTGVTAAAAALGCPVGTVGPTRTRTNAKLRRAREFAAHTSVA